MFATALFLALPSSLKAAGECQASIGTSFSGPLLTVSGSMAGECAVSDFTIYMDGVRISPSYSPCTCPPTCVNPCQYSVDVLTSCMANKTYQLEVGGGCSVDIPGGSSGCNDAGTGSATSSFTLNYQPSISTVSFTPDSLGSGTVSIGYDFPNTNLASQRMIRFYVNDVLQVETGTNTLSTASGAWNFPWNVACWKTGSYDFKAIATHCNGTTAQRVESIPINTTPTASISVSASADANGDYTISVPYSFPNTPNNSALRDIEIYLNGKLQPNLGYSAPTQSGTYPFKSKACGEFKAVAIACDQYADPAFRAESGEVQMPTDGCVEDFNSCPATKDECKPDEICFLPLAPAPSVGLPINVGSGDMRYDEHLFAIQSEPLALQFGLTYHSARPIYESLVPRPLGARWHHSFSGSMRPVNNDEQRLYHITGDGKAVYFERQIDGTWKSIRPAGDTSKVSKSGGEYLLDDNSTITRFSTTTGAWLSTTDRWGNQITGTYSGGQLTTVTDQFGRQVVLTYSNNRISTITAGSSVWRFTYTGDRLTAIFDPMHPGTTPWRTYDYVNDATGQPHLLTAVRDEAAKLLEGHTYDSADRAITSYREGNREHITVEYNAPSPGKARITSKINDTTNSIVDYTLTYHQGRYRVTATTGGCPTCGGSSGAQTATYDTNNRVTSHTDAAGILSNYTYDTQGRLTSITEAVGTPQERVTSIERNDATRPWLITKVTHPSVAKPGNYKTTSYSWNATDTVLTVTESGYVASSDPTPTTKTTTTTYDGRHRIITIDGVRTDPTDTTARAFYPDTDSEIDRRGRLQTITGPHSLTTSFDDYDIFGTARLAIDPNGVQTEVQTDAKGRTTTSTRKAVTGDPNEATDYVTTQTYDGRDRLTAIELPRSNVTRFRHEDGTNATTDTIKLDLSDNEVERRHTTYDLAGNITVEEDQTCSTPASTCTSWVTKRSSNRVYNNFGQLTQVQHPTPAGARIAYTYDALGRLKTIADENHTTANTTYDYDPVGRLKTVTQTLGAGTITTNYTYDPHDNLKTVTDPNGNTTTYAYDDFGQLRTQTSPVTGTTSYAYDLAGNLTSSTDANGAITTRTYDAANRILTADASRSGTTESVTWTYDSATAGNYGKGRLASMTDPIGATSYAYERRGLIRAETRSIEGNNYAQSYSYDPNGNRTSLTYPSGRVVTYTFDYADRPLTAASGSTTFVSGATYPSLWSGIANHLRQRHSKRPRIRSTLPHHG
jgi:YD repeat-containing protein